MSCAECVDDPEQRGDPADDEQRVAAAGGQRPEDLELEAPEAVEAGAERDRQRGGAEARRGGVAGRDAALQRDNAELRREADEEEGEENAARPRAERGVRPDAQLEAVGVGIEQRERGEQRRPADLREHPRRYPPSRSSPVPPELASR